MCGVLLCAPVVVRAAEPATLGDAKAAEGRRLLGEANGYYAQGRYAEGIPVAERAVATLRAALGDRNAEVAGAIRMLGELNRMAGNLDAADALIDDATARFEKLVGRDHVEVASCLAYKAEILRLRGRFREAIPILERVIPIFEKAFGPSHPHIATMLNSLGEFHRHLGEYAKAEPLQTRAMAIFEAALGPEHPYVATSCTSLGELYKLKGEYTRAEPLLRRAVAINTKALGAEHPWTASVQNNLADFLRETGEYAQAEPLYVRAIATAEKVLGAEHTWVAVMLVNLAILRETTGANEQAGALLDRALAINEKMLGGKHPTVGTVLGHMAGMATRAGEFTKAERLWRRAREIFEVRYGQGHLETAAAIDGHADVLSARGESADAEVLYKKALALREKALGPTHPHVATSLSALGRLYQDRGDRKRAEPALKRALELREAAYGPMHPAVADALNDLAAMHYGSGYPNDARPLFERSLEIRERAFGADHVRTAVALGNLASVHYSVGDLARAEPLLRRALALDEKHLGATHATTAIDRSNLAGLLERTGRLDEAAPLFEQAVAHTEKALGASHPNLATMLGEWATLEVRRGHLQHAIALKARANAIDERHVTRLLATGNEEQKVAYLGHALYDVWICATMAAEANTHREETAALAHEALLQRKGRVVDAVAEGVAVLRAAAGPKDRALLDELTELRARLAALVLQGGTNVHGPEVELRLRAMEGEIARKEGEASDRVRALLPGSEPVRLGAVQRAIPEGAALVEYLLWRPFLWGSKSNLDNWGPARYGAFVLQRQGSTRFVDLGEAAAIDRAVKQLRRAIVSNDKPDVKPMARALDALVGEPVRKLAGSARTIYLGADGELHVVPFAALVDEGGHYVVEQWTLVGLTSGRDLLRPGRGRPRHEPAIVMADPDFDAPPPGRKEKDAHRGKPGKQLRRPAGLLGFRFDALPATREEAKAVAALIPRAKMLLGKDASETALRAVAGPEILHMATHGFFLGGSDVKPDVRLGNMRSDAQTQRPRTVGGDNPLLRSGLALAGFNRGAAGLDDGVLTALEAASLDLVGTRLVVLSACETGLGEIRLGEGVHGLQRAFAIAGAESLVMSLWSVDDDATRDLFLAFHKHLRAGLGRAEALRKAQRELLANPATAHPADWAAFFLVGEAGPIAAP